MQRTSIASNASSLSALLIYQCRSYTGIATERTAQHCCDVDVRGRPLTSQIHNSKPYADDNIPRST
eukprot:scaffold98328_cov35-Prasinocladus_malaysianus.AAC.2